MTIYECDIVVIGTNNVSDIISSARSDVGCITSVYDNTRSFTKLYTYRKACPKIFFTFDLLQIDSVSVVIPICKCILIVPSSDNASVSVIRSAVSRIRDYNLKLMSASSRYIFQVVLSYPTEPIPAYRDLESECTAISTYFTTDPVSTLMIICKHSLTIRYNDLILLPTSNVVIHMIIIRHSRCMITIITEDMIRSRIILPTFYALDQFQARTNIGIVNITDRESRLNTHVFICNRHDIPYKLYCPEDHCYIKILILYTNPSCKSPSCIHECTKLKSRYHRNVELDYDIDRCIIVYDECNLLQQIIGILCNHIDIRFIPYLY